MRTRAAPTLSTGRWQTAPGKDLNWLTIVDQVTTQMTLRTFQTQFQPFQETIKTEDRTAEAMKLPIISFRETPTEPRDQGPPRCLQAETEDPPHPEE